jgi:acetylornithine deacetylase/succinyl-diaminopimelate desuccinylase-like protein
MNSFYGLKYLVKHRYVNGGSLAIIGEPSNLKLATASLGNLWITIKIKGKKAHSGMYWKGINAIDVMIEIINQIKNIINDYKYKEPIELTNFPNLNVGIIRGGTHPGSVPGYCEVTIDIRFKDESERDFYNKQLHDVINVISTKYGCKYKIEQFGGGGLPAWSLDLFKNEKEIHRCLAIIEQSYAYVTGQALERCIFLGGSDAGIFVHELNTPAVIIGPGSLEQAHRPNEWVYIKEVIRAAKLYEEIIRRWI